VLKNLKPVGQRVYQQKPKIEDPTLVAFSIVDQMMARRAAIEGDDEKDDSWSNEGWSNDEEN